ncbi:hypothetical protein Bbelb_372850 [Branchiostoma belcheri]|nr:hypothetical protein Bbelb_372850 [Branchiostoma belcheri]
MAKAAKDKGELPFVMISVDNDTDKHHNDTHWCRHAWEDAGSVKVALGGNLTLKIVPMSVNRNNRPQIVAVVISDVSTGMHRNTNSVNQSISAFGHEKMKNLTCFLKARSEMHRHIFPVPVSSTSSGVVCKEKATETQTTGELQTHPTTKVILDQTSTNETPAVTVPKQRGKGRPLPGGVGIFTVVTVASVVLVALLIAACIIRKRCGSLGHHAAQAQGPPLAVISTSHWMISGANSRAVGVSYQDTTGPETDTGTQDTQCTGDDPQYSRIPDQYFNYYNTRPWVQHPYWEIPDHNEYYNTRPWVEHPYWEIPDDYNDYYNTRRQEVQHPYSGQRNDDDDTVRFYAAAAEVVLPSPARQGRRHPGYGTAPLMRAARNNYQPVRQRMGHAIPYETLPRVRSDPHLPVRQRTARVRPYGTLPRVRSDPHLPVRQRMAHVRQYGTLLRVRSDPQIPVRQRTAYVKQYEVRSANRYRARDLGMIGKYGRPQGRVQRRTLYHNPAAHWSMAATQRANVRYQAAHTPGFNKTRTNMSYQQTHHMPITESIDDVLTVCQQDSKGQIYRSKMINRDVLHPRINQSLNRTGHRRQSI